MSEPFKEIIRETTCYHCGDDCREQITAKDKNFCCYGCKAVYELLQENDLTTYYDLNKTPGNSRKKSGSDLSYLENEDIASRLLDFDSDQIGRVTFFLPAIHCSSCIWLLENLPSLYEGIVNCQVNFVRKRATITFRKSALSLREVGEMVTAIGYSPQITIDENKDTGKSDNTLIIRLAVAGFCFGNSMLISIPGYLDSGTGITTELKTIFGLVNIVLMLPVVTYAAAGYFRSALRSLLQKRINIDVPVAIGITILFIHSLQEIITGSGSGYADSLAGLVFFLLVGKWYQEKTWQALSFERTFRSFFPVAVNKLDGTNDSFVPIEQIRIGDRIRIRNEEVIPADGTLVNGNARIDYSFVTGESLPHQVGTNEKVYAGGRQKGAAIELEVTKEVAAGYLTDLWNHSELKKAGDSGLQNLINRISGVFTASVLLIALTSGLIWYFYDASQVWNVVASVMIIACPCALALALPFAYGHALRYLGRNNFYLKNADVIEKIAFVRHIIFDKTGTLTTGDKLDADYEGEMLSDEELSFLHTACANSMHPYSRLLEKYLTSVGIAFNRRHSCEFQEIEGKGIIAEVEGHELRIGSSAFLGASDCDIKESQVHIAIDGVYRGSFRIRNEYRRGIFRMLERLKEQFDLSLLSGDSPYEEKRLYPYFKKMSFRQSPEEKFLVARKMQKNSPLMMIGDGLNDAGALKMAEVGISVTDDIHRFSPACDAIIRGEELNRLNLFIEFCRSAYRVVKLALILSVCYNLIGLYFAVTGQLTPVFSAILMPLSSVSVVGLITLMIRWKAQQLISRGDQGVSDNS